jgi:nucleoside-diphosphate-sugar epimerase
MAKILVTGSSGFLGTHLVDALQKRGDEVVKIPHKFLDDPLELEVLCLFEEPFDYIFHLAAYGNMIHQQEMTKIFMANLWGTFDLLKATKDIPYKAFINISTSSVNLPHQTMYSVTKRGAEELCKAFVNEYAKPIVSIRPFSIYGPGEASHRFIPTVFRSCMNGEPMTLSPDGVHDWTYIDDMVKTMIGAAEAVAMSEIFDTIECGTGVATTNRQVVDLIEKITGKKANITGVGIPRAFDRGDWKAEDVNKDFIQLEEGLQKYYDSIKK